MRSMNHVSRPFVPSPGRLVAVTLAATVLLTGCTGAAAPSTSTTSSSPNAVASPTDPPTTASREAPTASSGSSSASAPAAAQLDATWATATQVDVNTGESFRITDLVGSGKVVFLETMAIWCSNCRAQQMAALAAFEELDPAKVEWVVIDVESSETPEALARYSKQNGFPFTYAIADAAFARALVDDFGETVLSPPSVNIIVIGTDGRVTHLHGHKSAEELRRLASENGA